MTLSEVEGQKDWHEENIQRFHDFENQGGSEISRVVLRGKKTIGEEPPGNASYP